MFSLQNILLIIILLFLFNYIQVNENFIGINYNKNDNFKSTERIPIYGNIQYEATDKDDDNVYRYQDFEIIKKNQILELSNDKNQLNKYNTLTELNDILPSYNKDSIYSKSYDNTFKKTNLPSEQDYIYDNAKKFNQPSDADIYNPLVPSQIEYTDRKIQEVYEEIVNNVKKNNPDKKIKQTTSDVISGGFNESILKNIMVEYEDDEDGLSYDPYQSNLLAI